jgi:hypothetical protein
MPHNLNMAVFTNDYAVGVAFLEPVAFGQRMHEW